MAALLTPTTPAVAQRADAPPEPPHTRASVITSRVVTALIVIGPAAALGVGVPLLWGEVINLRDVVIGAVLYFVTGHGITIGYHRLFAHHGFTANRPLKIALAAAGSMAVEGSVIGWVAAHRRHHRFSDRDGDPHSPHGSGEGLHGQLRGLLHAHVGWLFTTPGTSESHYAPDLVADPDLVLINRLWAVFAIGSLLLPFGLGWALSGTVVGALTTFLWAGVVRMMLLHHTTWSVNSICHMFGARPFRTRDHSANVALLSVVSMGESFHNLHHAYPASARHGVLRYQLDSSARIIALFERAGWATNVRWPQPSRVAALLNGAKPAVSV